VTTAEKEELFLDAVQSPQVSPHPAMNGRALVPYTPHRPKPKRKSNRDKEEAEDAVAVYETGDSLRKLMAKAIAAAETMIKRPRRSMRGLISNIQDPKLLWGQLSMQTFVQNLPMDASHWDSAFDKHLKQILKEQRNVARQEDNAFIIHQVNTLNDWVEEAITNIPK